MDFLQPNYVVAQYLGVFYLSQTGRMALALKTPAQAKSALFGATVINSLLCLTSVGRIAGGIFRHAWTV